MPYYLHEARIQKRGSPSEEVDKALGYPHRRKKEIESMRKKFLVL